MVLQDATARAHGAASGPQARRCAGAPLLPHDRDGPPPRTLSQQLRGHLRVTPRDELSAALRLHGVDDRARGKAQLSATFLLYKKSREALQTELLDRSWRASGLHCRRSCSCSRSRSTRSSPRPLPTRSSSPRHKRRRHASTAGCELRAPHALLTALPSLRLLPREADSSGLLRSLCSLRLSAHCAVKL